MLIWCVYSSLYYNKVTSTRSGTASGTTSGTASATGTDTGSNTGKMVVNKLTLQIICFFPCRGHFP